MAKVLIIEDEHELRELIAAELQYFGHQTVEAADGEQGIKTILSESPDIILADINMPKMNGHELRRRLQRAHPEYAKIPFIYVTALADETDIADGRLIGVEHYVTKPIDFGELRGWIKDLTAT